MNILNDKMHFTQMQWVVMTILRRLKEDEDMDPWVVAGMLIDLIKSSDITPDDAP